MPLRSFERECVYVCVRARSIGQRQQRKDIRSPDNRGNQCKSLTQCNFQYVWFFVLLMLLLLLQHLILGTMIAATWSGARPNLSIAISKAPPPPPPATAAAWNPTMSSNTKSRQASAVPTYIKRCNKKDVGSSVLNFWGQFCDVAKMAIIHRKI
jgi:hypothetical protein